MDEPKKVWSKAELAPLGGATDSANGNTAGLNEGQFKKWQVLQPVPG